MSSLSWLSFRSRLVPSEGPWGRLGASHTAGTCLWEDAGFWCRANAPAGVLWPWLFPGLREATCWPFRPQGRGEGASVPGPTGVAGARHEESRCA